MNKLFFFLLIGCLGFGSLQAQDEYYQVIDPIFEHIDLNRVPKGKPLAPKGNKKQQKTCATLFDYPLSKPQK